MQATRMVTDFSPLVNSDKRGFIAVRTLNFILYLNSYLIYNKTCGSYEDLKFNSKFTGKVSDKHLLFNPEGMTHISQGRKSLGLYSQV